jgi:hypothetical protein
MEQAMTERSTSSTERAATDRSHAELPRRTAVGLVTAAWMLSLGFDFLLHGGVLARLYARESPFLLQPLTAFQRIPAGYLAFLLLTAGLLWLFRRLDVRGWRDGARLGLAVGLFIWLTLALGLWSITTARVDTLVAWTLGQGVELGLAGLVIGAGRAGTPLRRIWWRVGAFIAVCAVLTIVLQSVGWAPTARLG